MLTTFSWGYWGWGGSTKELVDAFDSVEAARGFGAPIFVDCRIRRTVRAKGFRGDAFERLLGPDRHRWLRGLGNEGVLDRAGMRLRDPSEVRALVDLVEHAAGQRRRVIFFCACPFPRNYGRLACHRDHIATLALREARRRNVELCVVEWPGGEPKRLSGEAFVAGATHAVSNEAESVAVPEGISHEIAASTAWSSVMFTRDRRPVYVTPARHGQGRWAYEILWVGDAGEDVATTMREVRDGFGSNPRLSKQLAEHATDADNEADAEAGDAASESDDEVDEPETDDPDEGRSRSPQPIVTVREILDALGRDPLVRLIHHRGLGTSRENDDRRQTLARSYRGDIEALIRDLDRADLVTVFSSLTFPFRKVQSYLPNPNRWSHAELRAFAIRAFAGRRVRIPRDFTPLEGTAKTAGDGLFADVGAEWSRPRQLTVLIRTLGDDPPSRLRTSRFQGLLSVLYENGIEACLADDESCVPLADDAESPGIDAKVRLRRFDPDAITEDGARKDGQTDEQVAADDGGDGDPFADLTSDWSRPRQIARVLQALGDDAPERLRTTRFQEAVGRLRLMGIELCIADDEARMPCTGVDESPGASAKVRLRRSSS